MDTTKIPYLEDYKYCAENLCTYKYGEPCPICGKELNSYNENKLLCCGECGCGSFYAVDFYYTRTYRL